MHACMHAHQIVMYAVMHTGDLCVQEETVLQQILSSWLEGTGYVSLSTEQLQAVLQQASDVYYNSGQPAIPDSLFDQLKDALHQRDPTAPFLSEVGAPVVRNRVTLPFGLYSLDKVKPGSRMLPSGRPSTLGPSAFQTNWMAPAA